MLESLDYKYDLAKDGEDALALYRPLPEHRPEHAEGARNP